MPKFKITKCGFPGFSETSGKIGSDDGRSYVFASTRDLSFSVTENENIIVIGKSRNSKGKTVEIIADNKTIGYIHQGILRHQLEYEGKTYKFPGVFSPKIPELGIECYPGNLLFGCSRINVTSPSSEILAISMIVYKYSYGCFFGG